RAPPSRSYRPQPESRSRCRSDCSSKNRCQASFVCPYKSPQKLSFISARKCWKCSLIGIIFAIGCRSPFQERLSLVRQSQLTPSRLLHNQRYVTLVARPGAGQADNPVKVQRNCTQAAVWYTATACSHPTYITSCIAKEATPERWFLVGYVTRD